GTRVTAGPIRLESGRISKPTPPAGDHPPPERRGGASGRAAAGRGRTGPAAVCTVARVERRPRWWRDDIWLAVARAAGRFAAAGRALGLAATARARSRLLAASAHR